MFGIVCKIIQIETIDNKRTNERNVQTSETFALQSETTKSNKRIKVNNIPYVQFIYVFSRLTSHVSVVWERERECMRVLLAWMFGSYYYILSNSDWLQQD